jgi:hypothetical protein
MATAPDYTIVTIETDERPYPWRWEYAGGQALAKFLEALAKEERRDA